MPRPRQATFRIRCAIAAAVAGLLVCAAAVPASAQSAAARYERGMTREKSARLQNAPPAMLREIARYYEGIVRAYPRSGYADNALWQAAGLYELAYQRSRSAADLEKARRLLSWLKREYPTGSLARQVSRRVSELNAAAKPAPKATARSAPKPESAPKSQSVPKPQPLPIASAPPPPKPAPPPPARRTADATPAPSSAASAATSPAGSPAAAPPASSAASSAAAPAASPAATMPAVADIAAEPADDTAPAIETAVADDALVSDQDLPDVSPAVFVRSQTDIVDAVPAFAAVPPAASPTNVSNAVREITRAALPKGDRVTIELGRETSYVARRDGGRVQIEIRNASIAAGVAERAADLAGPLVKSVAVAEGPDEGSHVVLELNGEPRFSTFPLYNPFRLVIDVESDEPAKAAAAHVPARTASAAPASPPAPPSVPPSSSSTKTAAARPPAEPPPTPPSSTSRGDYSLARQLGLGVSKIVIDPGHGGHDPGALANGVNEASIVLDVALRVETLLRAQPGFEVVLTRRTDEFIPLEARTALANREQADMFLSIHANSSPRRTTRGVETYLLDFASNPDAEALAARENATSAQTMRLLPDIVKTIALNNKVDESMELATLVQTSLIRRLSPLSKEFQDLGVKRAPFVVLIGAQMPSVLAEISFLTNRTDASLLKQAAHRQRIAEALADAVLRYRASLKGAPAREPKTAARR